MQITALPPPHSLPRRQQQPAGTQPYRRRPAEVAGAVARHPRRRRNRRASRRHPPRPPRQPGVMRAPAVWLASGEADGVTGRRIIASQWDERLPVAERLEKASAPAAWPQLGRQAAARPR